MKKFDNAFPLFAIILLEGFVVLSSELVAIRQSISFVGSGTDTVSIIIAAVLMPLAFGYHYGGKYVAENKKNHKKTIRKKLIQNIVISMPFLLCALSYIILDKFFLTLTDMGIKHRLLQTSIFAGLFLLTPVFLLGQTIPLITNYFKHYDLSVITGKILFYSTIGSFMGAIFTTLVLMAWIGVNNTIIVIFIVMLILVVILSRKIVSPLTLAATAFTIIAIIINSDYIMRYNNILESNLYNTISILDQENAGTRHLILNKNPSSKYGDNRRKYYYIEFAEHHILKPIQNINPPKDILVIGAGAFTFGSEDKTNIYDFVDIDKRLKPIAEQHILKRKLHDNVTFHAKPARAFLSQNNKTYDVILLDTYFGKMTVPETLITQQFFKTIKKRLNNNGILAINIVASPNFLDAYSRNIDNTIRSVYPHVSRIVIRGNYDLWSTDPTSLVNAVYLYRKEEKESARNIYTDNLNRSFIDRP